jgi:hypothetical protein
MEFLSFLSLLIVSMGVYINLNAEEIKNGREVQIKVKEQSVGNDHIMKWNMNLINKNGYVRKRVAYRYMKETNGLRKFLVRFLEPADIRKTGLLTWENEGKDDTQFLYLPALKKTRRIATTDKEQSFVGTDFNYEDMGNIKIDDYTYTETRTEFKLGEECYYYECYAEPGANTVYSRMNTWTSKKSFIRIYVEYFDKKGKKNKIGIAKNIKKIDGIWTPLYVSMENLEEKHKTELIVPKVVYNSGLSDELFGLINLKTAAREDF